MNTGEKFGVKKEITQGIDKIESDCRHLFETCHNTENGRLKVWVAPAALWSCSGDLLTMLWDMTKAYKSGLTIHVSETPFDRDAAQDLHGVPDAEVLEKLGILGPEVLMVHCVYLTERDMDMAREHGMTVSHNAVSNMYLSAGVAPVPQMLKKGLTVSLGLDGAASNNSQDMIELMKSTALIHKVHNLDPVIMTAEKTLEMATIDGAKALGMESEIGSIEVGKKADFFIYDPSLSAKSTPMHHPVSTLIYSGTHACVSSVVIDGNIILDEGKLIPADEDRVISQGQKAADSLSKRAGTDQNKYRPWKRMIF